jgi:GDPmannose 4,6-dehydratase
MKTALITGISGQDGSYLSEYLLSLEYRVFGLVRRETDTMRWLSPIKDRIEILYGDMRDTTALEVAVTKANPDEIYNLAGQVFVPTSWECPAETFDINVGGFARLLQIASRQKRTIRLYQASSSEMFGNHDGLCTEATPLNPTSPYGVSKTAAHRLADVYRTRGVYAVGGILFNHESPRRGPEMVTRKITQAIASAYVRGQRPQLTLGNLEARRDWGFAGDYIRAMHAMLQQSTPRDYVIGTGVSHSVREFIAAALTELKNIDPRLDIAVDECVQVDKNLLRTGEIVDLRADATAACKDLGWKTSVDFQGLVRMMLESDIAGAKQHLGIAARAVGV